MTTVFLAEANRLKHLQTYLEKNDTLLNLLTKHGSELHLLDYFIEIEKKRKNDSEQLISELKSIFQSIKIKKKLLAEENLNGLDLQLFKSEIIEIQEKIHSLRLKLLTTGDKLNDQEKTLWEVTEIFNQKVEEWEKPQKVLNRNFPAVRTTLPLKSEYKEVVAFTEFVNKSGGHENGWSSEDHQLFLKLVKKHKNNVDALSRNLNKLLPDITVEAVKEHFEWFQKYQYLKTEKDRALGDWRKSNRQNKKENIEGETQPVKKVDTRRLNDNNIRQKLEKWKQEKEEKQQARQIFEQMKKEEQHRIEEEKQKQHNEIKKVVSKWREAKTMKEQTEKFRKEIEEYHQKKIRAATANKLIKRFQTQDDLYVTKIKAIKLKENNQKKKRSKSSYLVERDPERILKPTKQWIFRTKKDNFINELPPVVSYVPNIREIPRLKVPEWRKIN